MVSRGQEQGKRYHRGMRARTDRLRREVQCGLALAAGWLALAAAGCGGGKGAARPPSGADAAAASGGIARAVADADALEAEAGRLLAKIGSMEQTNRMERHVLHHNLGCVYRQAGRAAEAEKAYLEAIRLDPGAADSQLGLGLLYESDLNQPEKARACFERFLALSPGSPNAGDVRGRIERLRRPPVTAGESR